ncbi:MAG TPA: glycine--tRNA ligase, partial [Actinomycetota bacterium]
MEAVISLCKRRGIAFPSSEIYGGLRSSWDYGPLGVEIRRNIRNAWWRSMVHLRDDVVGLE